MNLPTAICAALFAAYACIGLLTDYARAASFDCAKATAPADKAICANTELSAKDDALGHLYHEQERKIQSRPDDHQAFVADGRRWLAMRMACNDDVRCLTLWYDQRLVALAPKATVANTVTAEASDSTERKGDPYLNHLFALIDQKREYPADAAVRRLEGTAVYLIRIRADGTLTNIALERSSGTDILDQAALKMIRQAAPFPPPPQNEFPGPSVVLEVSVHLSPPGVPRREGSPALAQVEYWYYCDQSKAYYPYVTSCDGGWRELKARPSNPPPSDSQTKPTATQTPTVPQRTTETATVSQGKLGQIKSMVANRKVHQWRSDRSDQSSTFSFLGLSIGDNLQDAELIVGPDPATHYYPDCSSIEEDAKQKGSSEFECLLLSINPSLAALAEALTNKPAPSDSMTGYFSNRKLAALRYTFQFSDSDARLKTLLSTYGNPTSRSSGRVNTEDGRQVDVTYLFWDTPAGVLEFDERYEDLLQSAIFINKDFIEKANVGTF